MFNLDEYLSNFSSLPWLKRGIVFLAKSGSHAYGMNTPESDLDLKGFAIAPMEYYLGFLNTFEQAITANPSDFTVYNIDKFLHLAVDANPSITELIFTDPSDWILSTDTFDEIHKHRHKFISKKCKHTYSGYAISQIKRIKTHRRWLLDPPTKAPERKDFGLPEHTLIPKDQLGAAEAQIRKKIEFWKVEWPDNFDEATKIQLTDKYATTLAEMSLVEKEWELAGKALGYDSNFMEIIVNEKRYHTARAEWEQYQTWLRTRNPKRAALEAKFGYDTKHGAHVVRLMRQCREILTTGNVIVKRPDAEELLAIRGGAWSYDKLISWAEEQDKELDVIAKESTLPREPDRKFINDLCVRLIMEFNLNNA